MALPVPPATRRPPPHPQPRRAFTEDQRLDAMIGRMISTNSLAAFTQEVTRSAGIEAARGAPATQAARAENLREAAAAAPQRTLEQVPPPPQNALPRGSLLDLRV